MPHLEIRTADEMLALDLEDRWRARRAGRETEVSRRVLRAFLDSGGPVSVEQVVAAFPGEPAPAIYDALAALAGCRKIG
jgi:hypothetical protein